MVRKVLASVLVSLAVLAGPSAHAANQLDVRNEPQTQGPLTRTGRECDSQTLKSGGAPVIKVAFCVFFYTYDSIEIDLENDYGVVWAQASFDALKGFCTTDISFYVEMSEGTQTYEQTPAEPLSTTKARSIDAEVLATAGNHAVLETGLVTQRFRLYPGKMSPVPTSDDQRRVGLSWSGRTPAKLAFATRAEVGWPSLSSPSMRVGADTIRLTSGQGC